MNLSTRLANTILHRYPRADLYPYKPWCYPQGFMLWGMEAMYRNTGEERYRAYILEYCNTHVPDDGQVPAFTGESMDDILPGAILVWAWQQTGQEKFKIACEHIRKAFDTYPRNADGGFWHGKHLPGEMWVDGVFMGQMFLTKYAAAFPDAKGDFAESVRQLTTIYKHCNKANSGLLLHAYSEDKRPAWANPITGLSPEVWSEGLGWYALILPHTLDVMEESGPGRAEIVAQYRQLLYGLQATQDKQSGLWHQVVDKGGQADNWTEASGSAMFLYSVLRGMAHGVVPKAEFGTVAQRAYAGLQTKIRPEGEFLDVVDACEGLCVQNGYGDYINYPKKRNAQEAVAAMLWAAAEMEGP